MPRRIHLEPHLTDDELHSRYRHTCDPVERSHWHFLWLLASGMTASAVAAVTGYSAYWIGQIARRYNTDGPEGMRDRRHAVCAGRPALPASHLTELGTALAAPHPEGDRWCGRTVAHWLAARLGRYVRRQLGWRYLRRLGARWLKPRPRHVRADALAQAEFKAHLRPLLRQVATAFPHAQVELWATDEHRIGLKPLLHKVWCFDGQRPLAPVQHRFEWRYLVGFVHRASGRTVFHLAETVNIPLFEVELAAFARQVGASPTKQIILVLNRAGWRTSVRLRVPGHVHLHFLPPHSPELQPAEHLWPLTNTVLANRHFATIDELEDVQAARCVALQARRDLIRSTTLFHWWPQRIKKRQGPRRISSRIPRYCVAPYHRSHPTIAGGHASCLETHKPYTWV
ncbi:MAG TPA: IS630 family transposase [Ktedonobacterales bacterium]|jgi:transposase|nr:IS630 family transposase [Ktedonobacterales bacterium]